MTLEQIIADLHTHSTYSDGRQSPRQMAIAAAKKLEKYHLPGAVALTDHDTIEGLEEFLEQCDQEGVIGVPGVEIAVYSRGIDPTNSVFSSQQKDYFFSLVYAMDLRDPIFEQFPGLQKELKDDVDPNEIAQLIYLIIQNKTGRSRAGRFLKNLRRNQFVDYQNMRRHILEMRENYDELMQGVHVFLSPDGEKEVGVQPKAMTVDKGEILCYFSRDKIPEMRIVMAKMGDIENPSIYNLKDLLDEHVGGLDELALVLAHPFSLDSTSWGPKLARILGKDINGRRLENYHKDPNIFGMFHGVEVINAAHPVSVNVKTHQSVVFGERFDYYSHLAQSHLGNSDSHDERWLFAGYSLMDVDERSENGVIRAIQNGNVYAAGWGFNRPKIYSNGINQMSESGNERKEEDRKPADSRTKRVFRELEDVSSFISWGLLSPMASSPNRGDPIKTIIKQSVFSIPRYATQWLIKRRISLPRLTLTMSTRAIKKEYGATSLIFDHDPGYFISFSDKDFHGHASEIIPNSMLYTDFDHQ